MHDYALKKGKSMKSTIKFSFLLIAFALWVPLITMDVVFEKPQVESTPVAAGVAQVSGSQEVKQNPSPYWKSIKSDLESQLSPEIAQRVTSIQQKPGDETAQLLGLIITTEGDQLTPTKSESLVGSYELFLESYWKRVFPLQAYTSAMAGGLVAPFEQRVEEHVSSQLNLATIVLPVQDKSAQVALLVGIIQALQKTLAGKQNPEAVKLITIAYGENTDLVNRACDIITFDTLLHLQSASAPSYLQMLVQVAAIAAEKATALVRTPSPIESKSGSFYTPSKFRRLYNFYSKEAKLVSERKYRQQRAMLNERNKQHTVDMPVKNISCVKRTYEGNLEHCTSQDLLGVPFTCNLPALINDIEAYELNYDLMAQVLDEMNYEEVVSFEIEEESPSLKKEAPASAAVTLCNLEKLRPVVVINRFPTVEINRLIMHYGDGELQEYAIPFVQKTSGGIVAKDTLEKDQIDVLKTIFTQEFRRSELELFNLLAIPSKGWNIAGGVQTDLNNLLARYQSYQVLSSYKSLLNQPDIKLPDIIERGLEILDHQLKEELGAGFTLDKQYAREQIYLGAWYANALFNNVIPATTLESQTGYLRSIIALMWFLYAGGLVKNQVFIEGTFILQDLQFAFDQYLMKYIMKFNPSVTGISTQDQPLLKSLNPFGYPRGSSHFDEERKLFRHYGIDIRFGSGGEIPMLPAFKRHILFGKLNQEKELIFIKLENYGLYIYDGFLMHGYELGQAQLRKIGATKKSDDAPEYRKERIPKAFLQSFESVVQDSKLSADEKARLIKQAKIVGIKILQDPQMNQLSEIRELQKSFGPPEYDHPELRWGREIILTHDDLLKLIALIRPDLQAEGARSALTSVLSAPAPFSPAAAASVITGPVGASSK